MALTVALAAEPAVNATLIPYMVSALAPPESVEGVRDILIPALVKLLPAVAPAIKFICNPSTPLVIVGLVELSQLEKLQTLIKSVVVALLNPTTSLPVV